MITSEDLHPLVYQLGQISKLFWVEFVAHFEDAQAMLRLGANKLVGFKSFSVEVFH